MLAEDTSFRSLGEAIKYDLTFDAQNTVFELEEGSWMKVLQINEDGSISVGVNDGTYALLVMRGDYVDGNLICGPKYFRLNGTGKFSFNTISKDRTVRKFREVSEREAEQIDAIKQEQAAIIERQRYEAKRLGIAKMALKELHTLTDDEKVLNDAYDKVQKIYDEAYKKTLSENDAKAAAIEMASRLIGVVKKEIEAERVRKEKEFQKWAKEHPEEYKEMLRAEEEERRRKAKEKLDAEIAENTKRMEKIRDTVEKYRRSNARGLAPETFKDVCKSTRFFLNPFDPWGGRFEYLAEGGKFKLMSFGPDRRTGTDDDIVMSVDALQNDELPAQRELVRVRKLLSEKSKEVDGYKSDFIPNICGFTFGSKKPIEVRGVEQAVNLKKSFRDCKTAILVYGGECSPRLISVCLVAKYAIEDDGEVAAKQEAEKVMKMLERHYGVRFSTSYGGNSVVGTCSNKGKQITVRNDALIEDAENQIALTVEFADLTLSRILKDLDELFAQAEECEQNAKTTVIPPQKQKEMVEKVDDEGLDVLTEDAAAASNGKEMQEDVKKPTEADSELPSSVKEQIEEIRQFRERMKKRGEERQREAEVSSGKRSGIIEAKSEGPVISTSEGVGVKIRRGSGGDSGKQPQSSIGGLLRRPRR